MSRIFYSRIVRGAGSDGRSICSSSRAIRSFSALANSRALTISAGRRLKPSGGLSTVAGTREIAEQVNRIGRFDAVINVGVGYRERPMS
jgi:hypothetical protein